MKKYAFNLIVVILLGVSGSLSAQEENFTDKNLNNQLKLGYGSSNLTTTYFLSYESQSSRFFSALGDISWLTAGASFSYTSYDLVILENFNVLGISSRFTVLLDELLKELVKIPTIVQPYTGLKVGYEFFLSSGDEAFAGGLFSSGALTQFLVGINVNIHKRFGVYFEIGGEQSNFNLGLNIR